MPTPKRLHHNPTQAELDQILRTLPPDLESTPEEDAQDNAAFERGLEQIKQGRWIWFEDLDRKYPDHYQRLDNEIIAHFK